jgi:hypothetical protein
MIQSFKMVINVRGKGSGKAWNVEKSASLSFY